MQTGISLFFAAFRLIFRSSITLILGIISLFLFDSLVFAQEVVRKTQLIRGADYTLNVFYSVGNCKNVLTARKFLHSKSNSDPAKAGEEFSCQGDKEVARFSESADGVYDQTGNIPNGEIKFEDHEKKIYGVENYKNGKKHGIAKIFYEDGELKEEASYVLGKLQYKKEYYKDGNVRYEVDYQNARENVPDQRETGVGKLYFPNGNLKYEWQFTNNQKSAFKKSYNTNGEIRYEEYFDEDGSVITDSSKNNITVEISPAPSPEISDEGEKVPSFSDNEGAAEDPNGSINSNVGKAYEE